MGRSKAPTDDGINDGSPTNLFLLLNGWIEQWFNFVPISLFIYLFIYLNLDSWSQLFEKSTSFLVLFL